MTLPIKWRVIPGAFTGYQQIDARVTHNGVVYAKQMVMPATHSKATWWLCVAAIQAEITNAVKTPPAD